VIGVLIFAAAGGVLGFGALLVGLLVRPRKPGGLKNEIYECGEPTVGPAWVQFDLRFYVVALLFLIFDVEIAMLYPWAVVYKEYIECGLGGVAFYEMLFFFGLLVMGFLYLWRFGYLDWVRSKSTSFPKQNESQEQKKGLIVHGIDRRNI
jgi:NADH-quinone oxidoreductase subunit A